MWKVSDVSVLQGRLPLLFCRTRNAWTVALAVLVTGVVCYFVPFGLLSNPAFPSTSMVLAALPGLAGSIFLAPIIKTAMESLEAVIPQRRIRMLKLAWFLIFTLGLCVAGGVVFWLRGVDSWWVVLHVRNTCFGVGLATLLGLWLPATAAWLPIAGYLGACWLAGTSDGLGTARPWAIPYYIIDSPLAGVAVLTVFLLAGFCYVLHRKA